MAFARTIIRVERERRLQGARLRLRKRLNGQNKALKAKIGTLQAKISELESKKATMR